jgi:hypothetical protein
MERKTGRAKWLKNKESIWGNLGTLYGMKDWGLGGAISASPNS